MVRLLATLDEYKEEIKSSKLVVIDFTASWCPPCQMIAPKFAELSEKVKDKATLVKIDVDDNSAASEAAEISCMPTFQFYKDGNKIHEIQGANIDAVTQAIEQFAWLNPSSLK